MAFGPCPLFDWWIMPEHRHLWLAVPVLAALLLCPLQASGSSVSLPILDNQARLLQLSHPSAGMEVESAVSGATNVSPLLHFHDDQPSRDFGDPTAYAELQWAGRIRLNRNRWWIEYGRGMRERYDGNQDAGQLWIDLHSDSQTQPAYTPEVASSRIAASWLGVGREFPLSLGHAQGTGSVLYRRITADDLCIRHLTGNVEAEGFTGMMHTISSDGRSGEGWSLDTQTRLSLGDRWLGQFTVEGLLGRISWQDAYIEDAYIVSPRVFEDPEGFLHDYYSVSGTIRHEDRSYAINPYYSVDLVHKGKPDLLLGVAWQRGMETVPACGAAWPQSKPWLPYLRYYPTQGRLQIGAVGRGWQFRVSGDDLASPKHAEIALSIMR